MCDDYVAAVSAHDLDRLMALFSADVEQRDPVDAPPNRGRDAVRRFFAAIDVPVTMTRIGPTIVTGDRALFMARVSVETESGLLEMTSADVLTVNSDCQITEILAFPDLAADPYEAPLGPRDIAP